MRTFSLVGSILVGSSLSLLAVACSSSSDQPAQHSEDAGTNGGDAGSDSDATVTTDGGGDTDSGPTSCNTLTLEGAKPMATFNAGALPTGTGGALPDGTYVLESATLYGVSSTSSVPIGREKLVVTGNTIQIGTENADDSTKVDTETDTIAVAGNTVTITETCPKAATPHTVQYSVEDASDAGDGGAGVALILYVDQGPNKQGSSRLVKQ